MSALKVPEIKTAEIEFRIKGISPLIQHAWSAKGRAQLAMTAQERKKVPKVARDPQQSAHDATYWMDDEQTIVGFPLLAFKAALIGACHKDLGIEKTLFRKSFFIPNNHADNLVPLEYVGEPELREDIVRVGMSQTDIRYRPQFSDWGVTVKAIVDSGALCKQDIVNLVTRAGFGVGVGEWRPERGGEFGRFKFDASHKLTWKELT